MGGCVLIPGVVSLGSVLGMGSVMIRQRLVPSEVPAGEVVLIPPALGLGQRKTPGPRMGPRFFPGLVGVSTMESVVMGICSAVETVVRLLPRSQRTV